MCIRIINLIIAIGALWLLGSMAGPALFRSSIPPPILLCIVLVLYAACSAWVAYAYHLITLKWHQNMVDRGRRIDTGMG